jgi:hypothetical protein
MNEIGIGTAQFGLKYGINSKKNSFTEIKKIITQAELSGIKLIDTSPVYGTAESILGNVLKSDHSFNIVSKTISIDGRNINYKLIEKIKKDFFLSLKNLKQKKLYALLIHNSDDLFQKKSELLYKAIKDLKDKKLIKKIGVSVYQKKEIDRILTHYDFDIFQLPCSIFDQRLVYDGSLEILHKKNIEMHARSVFLQGLLLMHINKIPRYFKPMHKQLLLWNEKLKIYNLSATQAALSFVINLNKFRFIIVGVNNFKQFKEINDCKFLKLPFSTKIFFYENKKYIDPRNWRKL